MKHSSHWGEKEIPLKKRIATIRRMMRNLAIPATNVNLHSINSELMVRIDVPMGVDGGVGTQGDVHLLLFTDEEWRAIIHSSRGKTKSDASLHSPDGKTKVRVPALTGGRKP